MHLLNDDPDDANKTIGSIIVTIVSGSSYDELFERVKQKSKDDTRVLVYRVHAKNTHYLNRELRQA